MSKASSRAGGWIRLGLSLALGVAFFLAVAQHIDAVPAHIDIPPWAALGYLASLGVYFFTRALRWKYLLAPLAQVKTGTVLLVALAGFMWIMLLPFRLGELARPLLLAQKTEITPGPALGTIALERVFDGLFVCAMFFLAMPRDATSSTAAALILTAWIAVAGFLALLIVLLAMARFPEGMGRLVRMTLGKVLPKPAAMLAGLARGVAQGLAALPNLKPLFGFLLVTALYWASNVFGTWLLARGCGLELGVMQVMAVVAVVNLALLVPGGPAQVGNFQTGVVLGLALFLGEAAIREQGSVFVFWLYLMQLCTTMLLGIAAQLRLGLSWRLALGVPRARTDKEEAPG